VERLLLATHSTQAIIRTMRERHGLGRNRTCTLIQRVRARWTEEDKEARPAQRAAAIRRIKSYIALANGERSPEADGGGWRTPPDFGALALLERLLADLQGTRAPVEVAAGIRLGRAAAAVIAAMTAEEVAECLEEAREERAKAAMWDRAHGDGLISHSSSFGRRPTEC